MQTSNYRLPHAIHRPRALARLLAAADARGVEVVGWYLPGFADPARDSRRTRAAVTFQTPAGHRFDGSVLDVEATAVRSVALRNRRLLLLSSRLCERRAYRHARAALRSLRARTGDAALPVHVIGGIASHASAAEVRGFARATVEYGAVGASLYDAPITRRGQWRALASVQRLR